MIINKIIHSQFDKIIHFNQDKFLEKLIIQNTTEKSFEFGQQKIFPTNTFLRFNYIFRTSN